MSTGRRIIDALDGAPAPADLLAQHVTEGALRYVERTTVTTRRRREDRLEALVEHVIDLERRGSRGFNQWRRRATVGFAFLTLAATVEGAVIVHNADVSRSALARAGAVVAIESCSYDNKLVSAIRGFVVSTSPSLEDAVGETFPDRNCLAEASPLRRKINP